MTSEDNTQQKNRVEREGEAPAECITEPDVLAQQELRPPQFRKRPAHGVYDSAVGLAVQRQMKCEEEDWCLNREWTRIHANMSLTNCIA